MSECTARVVDGRATLDGEDVISKASRLLPKAIHANRRGTLVHTSTSGDGLSGAPEGDVGLLAIAIDHGAFSSLDAERNGGTARPVVGHHVNVVDTRLQCPHRVKGRFNGAKRALVHHIRHLSCARGTGLKNERLAR